MLTDDYASHTFSPWELAERTWDVCGSHAGALLAIGFCVYLPAGAAAAVLFALGDENWAALPAALCSPLALAAVSYLVDESARDRPVNWRQALGFGWSNWARALLAQLWASLNVGMAALALIVPGIYYAVRYAFAVQVAVLRGNGVRESLDESAYLTGGRWWATFVPLAAFQIAAQLLAVLILGVGIVQAAVLVIFITAFGVAPEQAALAGTAPVYLLVVLGTQLVTVPLAALQTVLFLNLEAQVDARDAAELRSPVPEPLPARPALAGEPAALGAGRA